MNRSKARGRWHEFAIGLALIMALAVAATAANGAVPEKPIAEPCVMPFSVGDVCGTVNPSSNSEVQWYFAYDVGASCEGGAEALGGDVDGEAVQVRTQLSGLLPDTTYSYCLVVVSEGVEAFSDPLSFRTEARSESPPPPEEEHVQSAPPVPVPHIQPGPEVQPTTPAAPVAASGCSMLAEPERVECEKLLLEIERGSKQRQRCRTRPSASARRRCSIRAGRKVRHLRDRYHAYFPIAVR